MKLEVRYEDGGWHISGLASALRQAADEPHNAFAQRLGQTLLDLRPAPAAKVDGAALFAQAQALIAAWLQGAPQAQPEHIEALLRQAAQTEVAAENYLLEAWPLLLDNCGITE